VVFTSFSKSHILFEIHICDQAPGTFGRFTTIPLLSTKLPEKKDGDAIGSLSQGAARARRNTPVPAALPAGYGVELVKMLT
jgi:hypothetical protein